MNRIMHTAVHEITQNESGKENESIFFHRQEHDPENGRRNDDAGYRRHKKTFFIPGKMVVVTVHYVDEFLCFFAFCNGMKSKAMHQVFEESPEEPPCQKCEKNRRITDFQ